MTSDVTEDIDAVIEEEVVTETAEDIPDVTEEETYDMPEIIDEELALKRLKISLIS